MKPFVPPPIKRTASPMPEAEVMSMTRRQLIGALRKTFNAELDQWTDLEVDPSVTYNYTRMSTPAMQKSLIEGKLHPKLVVRELGWMEKQEDELERRGLIR